MKRLQLFMEVWSVPLLLAVIAFLSFGILAYQQGFYWDEWVFAWIRVHLGSAGMMQHFAATRPIRGILESGLTHILGAAPVAWQMYCIVMRWLTALSFWHFLRILWPRQTWQPILASLFFLVYPGFNQQPLAMVYHFVWMQMALFSLSLSLMLQTARKDKVGIFRLLIAVGLSVFVLLGVEYFFGLELLRPLVLWVALKEQIPDLKRRFKRTILTYSPFILSLGAYLYWRFVVYQDSNYTLDMANQQGANTFIAPLGIIPKIIETIPTVSIGAWMKILQQPFLGQEISLALGIIYGLVLVGGTVGMIYFFKMFVPPALDRNFESHTPWDILFVAFFLLIFAGLPFYLVNLPVQLGFPEDRFTLPFIPGVSMLLVGLLSFIKDSSRRFTLAALLIPLAMTLQIHNTDVYRKEWQSQRSFLWQLTWRAPHIQPGTTFLADDGAVFPHNDDEAFAFLVNWAYAPDAGSAELPYEYFWVSARLGYQLPGLQKGLPISMNHFAATFSGTTDQVLVVRFSPRSCLRVLDPRYDADAPVLPRDIDAPYVDSEVAYFALPRTTAKALPLSDPAWLVSDGAPPPVPEWLFGVELEHRWCYYFQKADLARQMEDWKKVARLGDQAFTVPYYPDDPAEYLPFIEAYGRLGRFEEAQALTEKASDLNPALRPMLCAAWQRIKDTSQIESNIIQTVIQSLKYCP